MQMLHNVSEQVTNNLFSRNEPTESALRRFFTDSFFVVSL